MTYSLKWNDVLDCFFRERQVVIKKNAGKVTLKRTLSHDSKESIWEKTYHEELSSFNDFEFDILKKLFELQSKNTYQPYDLSFTNRNLYPTSQKITVITKNAGTSLWHLLKIPAVFHDKSVKVHGFVNPVSYLLLIQHILIALYEIHKYGIIHGDIHEGNIAIPHKLLNYKDNHDSSSLLVELQLNKIKIIDFGYSIDLNSTPNTSLPLLRSGAKARISPKFAKILDEIDFQAISQISQSEIYVDKCYQPAFWRTLKNNPLKLLLSLNYKEDLYQLGVMLARIRDGGASYNENEGVIPRSEYREINALVDSLPEKMIRYGDANYIQNESVMPHLEYISSINIALIESFRQQVSSEIVIKIEKKYFDNSPLLNRDEFYSTPINENM